MQTRGSSRSSRQQQQTPIRISSKRQDAAACGQASDESSKQAEHQAVMISSTLAKSPLATSSRCRGRSPRVSPSQLQRRDECVREGRAVAAGPGASQRDVGGEAGARRHQPKRPPRGPKEVPKRPPRGFKTAPKTPQNCLQDAPKPPSRGPKRLQNCFQEAPQRLPKRPQQASKRPLTHNPSTVAGWFCH